MENLISLVFEKGVLFAIAVVAVGLVGYFIKKDRDARDEEFREYKKIIKDSQIDIRDATAEIKTASRDGVRAIRIEAASIIAQMNTFKDLLSREMLSIKVHSSQVHERSEKIIQSIDTFGGKIIIIEENILTHDKAIRAVIQAMASKKQNS